MSRCAGGDRRFLDQLTGFGGQVTCQVCDTILFRLGSSLLSPSRDVIAPEASGRAVLAGALAINPRKALGQDRLRDHHTAEVPV